MLLVEPRVVLDTKPDDFRKGPEGLMALVQDSGTDSSFGTFYVSTVTPR